MKFLFIILVSLSVSAERSPIELTPVQEAENTATLNRSKGVSVILKVLELNDTRQASDEVKLQFAALPIVVQARSLLETGRISLAIQVIQAAEVDGVIITQDIKTAILGYLDTL